MSMKEVLFSIFSVCLLAAIVVGEVERRMKAEAAMSEFRRFVAEGPRFTAMYGLALCEDIREIQRELGPSLEDCDAMRHELQAGGENCSSTTDRRL